MFRQALKRTKKADTNESNYLTLLRFVWIMF